MSLLNKITRILIPALIASNIWVVLYTNLVFYLNFKFPPIAENVFYRPGTAFPEPYEIPLYIILTLIFVLLLKFTCHLFSKLDQRADENIWLKIVVLILLSVLFLEKLGSYPLAGDLYLYPPRQNSYVYYIILAAYLGIMIVFLIESLLLKKLVKDQKKYSLLIYLPVITLIAISTFKSAFPISSLDQSYLLGPVWEAVSGKTVYTDIPSQYGFLSTLVYAAMFKLKLISFFFLPVLIWIFYIVEYFLAFYLIYSLSRSVPLSLIGLFSIITVNYFSEYHAPQTGPLRWIPVVIAIFLLYKFKRLDSRIYLGSISVLSLWMVDSGIAIFLAFIFTLLILVIWKRLSIKKAFGLGLSLIFYYAVSLTAINAMHLLFGMKPVDYLKLLDSIRKHAVTGLVMVPIDFHNYLWLVILVYFASIICIFRNSNRTNSNIQETRNKLGIWELGFEKTLLLFSTNLMFFASVYFVGRSVSHNLFIISLFFLLTTFLSIGITFQSITSSRLRFFLCLGLFVVFVAFPAFQKKELLSEYLLSNFQRLTTGSNIFTPQVEKELIQYYKEDVYFLKKKLTGPELAVLSTDDTYLLFLLKKRNLLDVNPIIAIDRKPELDTAIKRASSACPQKILVDCKLSNKCHAYKTFTNAWDGVIPILLENIEKNCRVKYKPTVCTNKLCIVEYTSNATTQ